MRSKPRRPLRRVPLSPTHNPHTRGPTELLTGAKTDTTNELPGYYLGYYNRALTRARSQSNA